MARGGTLTMATKTTTKTNGTPKRANPTPDELLALARQQRQQQRRFTAQEKAMIEAGENFIAALIRQEAQEKQENAVTV